MSKQGVVGGAIAVALLAYALLTHYVARLHNAGDWAVALAVTPSSLLFLSLTMRPLTGALKILPPAALAVLLGEIWPVLQLHIIWVYFVQHVFMFSAMGIWFGRSLLAQRQPLCTHFASFVHEHMSPPLLRYTRQITLAWSGFFFAMVLISVALFTLTSAEIWSFFANVLSMPLVILMFAGEYLVRRQVLPPEDLLDATSAFRAYKAAVKAQPAAGSKQGV